MHIYLLFKWGIGSERVVAAYGTLAGVSAALSQERQDAASSPPRPWGITDNATGFTVYPVPSGEGAWGYSYRQMEVLLPPDPGT